MIGGAVTFVNPEPLAPFADVIAAGEGEVLVPRSVDALREAEIARDLLRRLAAQARVLHPVVLRRAIRRWADRRGDRAEAGTGAPPVVQKAAVKTTERLDPPST